MYNLKHHFKQGLSLSGKLKAVLRESCD